VYSTDFKDEVIPARIPKYWIWFNVCQTDMYPTDPEDSKMRITNDAMRTWTWRLIGHAGARVDDIFVIDPRDAEAFHARGLTGRTVANNLASYPDNSYAGAVSVHPSFGMNGVFYGGHTNHSAFKQHAISICGFDSIMPNLYPHNFGGKFFVTHNAEVRRPSELITFAASRAGDVSGTAFYANDETGADSLTAPRDGFYKVLPPTSIPSTTPDHTTSYSMMPGWTAAANNNTFKAKTNQSTWGYLNARHFGTVAVARADGSARRASLEELRSMHSWDNFAPENCNATTGAYTWHPR